MRLPAAGVMLAGLLLAAAPVIADEPVPPPGLGFLWYPRSEAAAGKLTGETDFVDLILGGDKLRVFEQIKPPVRVVCLCLALKRHEGRPFPGVKETIEMLQAAGVPPERVVIGYNPERSPGTTDAELDNLLDSVKLAREMARAYGSPLLVGPGLREMSQREELYPELAGNCDIWLIQSQRLQMHQSREGKSPEEYRAGVERIVEMLRQGNPEIRIVVQIVAGAGGAPDRFNSDQIVAYIRAVEDLVYAVRIYGGSPELLDGVIERLRPEDG